VDKVSCGMNETTDPNMSLIRAMFTL